MSVYLDNAATTPLDDEVLEAMLPLFKENFGNPDSLHAYGRGAAYLVAQARASVAETLGVKPTEVYFTSGGTEANNWAVRMLGEGGIAVSAVEHASVLSAAKLRAGGCAVVRTNAGGTVGAEQLSEALASDMGVACVMAVNNETGTVQPLEELSALCRARGVALFSDCVQAATVLDLKRVVRLADGISLSAHKMYGPKGVGALIVKKGIKLRPLIAGGEQERSLRGGTLNAAGIVGFACALKKAQAEREAFCIHTKKLRDVFEGRVLGALGNEVRVDGENRAPNISHLTFAQGGEAFLSLLDLNGVACSGGAACSAHAALPSHVMLAMGRSPEDAKRGVRFSFGRQTTEAEALLAADIVIACAQR